MRLPGTPIDGPTVITQAGHYYLTRNITAPAMQPGIQLSSNDVTLDLGGFTIDASGSTKEGIALTGGTNIAISNGAIRGGLTGVDALGGVGVRISHVAVYGADTGFSVGAGALLEDCIAQGSSFSGIVTQGLNPTVRRCVVLFNDDIGIYLFGGSGALIEGSTIKGNNAGLAPTFGGIVIQTSTNATVRDNDMSGNGVGDVVSTGADGVIVDNVIFCPSSIVLNGAAVGSYAPVNATDPHTNRAHRLVC